MSFVVKPPTQPAIRIQPTVRFLRLTMTTHGVGRDGLSRLQLADKLRKRSGVSRTQKVPSCYNRTGTGFFE